MCTVIAAWQVWPEWPLVIAANRDELLERPAAPPAVRRIGGARLLAPLDLRAGGTWIGLNGAGVVAALTNRMRVPPCRDRRSRGEVVPALLAAGGAQPAARIARALQPRDYNPFHLLVADRDSAWIGHMTDESMVLDSLAPGVHVLTEQSLGAGPDARGRAVAALAESWPKEPGPDRGWIRDVLAGHGPAGGCRHLPGLQYGTRSSTIALLPRSGAAEWWHCEGPPCSAAFEDFSALAGALGEVGEGTDQGA